MALGGNVRGNDTPPSQYDQDSTSIVNISSTAYIAGEPEVGVSVTAPSSGRVFVSVGGGVRNNAATAEQVIIGFQIFEDDPAGALYQAADDEQGVRSCGIAVSQEYQYFGMADLITTLTPGRGYYFQVVHRSVLGNGTADLSSRDIMVVPVP